MDKKIRAVSFNIHKGFNALNREYTLDAIKLVLNQLDPDIVFLQEVHGLHPNTHKQSVSPLEILADSKWPHFSHGVNSIYNENFHGNAILSKYEILFWKNHNISTNPLEQRGLLHAAVNVKGQKLDLYCTHLNLGPLGQYKQVTKINKAIERREENNPLILAGDFNDWTRVCHKKLRLDSSNLHKTFPSFLPLVSLDRIYYRGLDCENSFSATDFGNYSDHNPIVSDFILK